MRTKGPAAGWFWEQGAPVAHWFPAPAGEPACWSAGLPTLQAWSPAQGRTHPSLGPGVACSACRARAPGPPPGHDGF